jgi:hypothetical protein
LFNIIETENKINNGRPVLYFLREIGMIKEILGGGNQNEKHDRIRTGGLPR